MISENQEAAMSIILAEPFHEGAVYELRRTVNRLHGLLGPVLDMAAEAEHVADTCDNGLGGVCVGEGIKVIDAAEALNGSIYILQQSLAPITSDLSWIVTAGNKEVFDDGLE
jgi:hypothetical protein